MENIGKYQDVIDRTPLFREEWIETVRKMREHPDAPVWNAKCGDRLTAGDLEKIRTFSRFLQESRYSGDQVPDHLIRWIESMKTRSGWFEKVLPEDFQKNRSRMVPMSRSDLQSRLELIVPLDEDMSRIILHPTSGTTGQPIAAPNHPFSTGCYDPILQYILRQHGVIKEIRHPEIAAVQICAQGSTITYHTVHSFYEGGGFAKVNILSPEWKDPEKISRYLEALKPVFLSGDPYAFYLYMEKKISYRPEALISTAIVLEKPLRQQLEGVFGCPVIDLYSLNETGPVAYSCPEHPEEYHVVSPDLFVEIADGYGRTLAEGEEGEILVTGGRNPYLPLLRYRTGDRGSMSYTRCSCGDPMPKITGFKGRSLVIFRDSRGGPVNPVDISKILRDYPVVRHQMIQKKDGSLHLYLQFFYDPGSAVKVSIRLKILGLFGKDQMLIMSEDLIQSSDKILPYIIEE